jgi:1-acyl-sn-glycerol-3-phosphate acyltransferase
VSALRQPSRGVFVLLLVMGWMVLGGLYQRLILWPAAYLLPGRRRVLVSAFMRVMSRGILGLLQLGGARFKRTGRLPTGEPCLVLMNHQSLLDILTVVLMAAPLVPAFVTRKRYAYGVPVISQCLRLLGCPIIDPRNDPRGASVAIARGAAEQAHGLVIFPEGHRSRDGRVRPFKSAGTEAALRARPVPVYLIVTDGFWRAARLADFVFHTASIRGVTEVLGPFTPPAEPTELAAFVSGLRETLVARLDDLRRRADGRA